MFRQRRHRLSSYAVWLAASLLCSAACGASPVGPTAGMVIEGPPTMAPGTTAKYEALIFKEDNSIVNLSRWAQWTSADPKIVEMHSDGLAIAKSRGEARITATYGDRSAPRVVTVLEDGTFKLTGRVIDADLDVGIAGAHVEVVGGTGTGLRTMTTANRGSYVLYGVAGAIQLRVSAEGFNNSIADVAVFGEKDHAIHLVADGLEGALSGAWTLTVSAPAGCDWLPAAAGTRQFLATITHSGSQRFTALLSSSSVYYADPLRGEVAANNITLRFGFNPGDAIDPPFYSVLDALEPRGFLGIRGTIRATLSGSTANGLLDGAFDLYQNLPSLGAASSCQGHGAVELRR